MMKKTVKPLLILAYAALTFTGCAKENSLDTIKDAQMCLNKATTTTAQTCVSKLTGIVSQQANQLKCAAYFIQEGYGSPSKLIDAIDSAKTGAGASSINMISVLSFSSSAQSAKAFDVCNSSGIAVYSQLSSLVQISTLAKAFNPAATTPADYAAAVNGLSSATLGTLVTDSYASSCSSTSTGSGEALSKFCTQLGSTLTTSNSTQIGDCLKYKIGATAVNPGGSCPPN